LREQNCVLKYRHDTQYPVLESGERERCPRPTATYLLHFLLKAFGEDLNGRILSKSSGNEYIISLLAISMYEEVEMKLQPYLHFLKIVTS
jgi:hypothetical protein